MTEVLLYVIKSTIYLSVFYAIFMPFMKKTTFFRFNRVVFMTSSALCFILPAIEISPAMFADIRMPITAIEEALAPTQSIAIEGITIGPDSSNIWLIIVCVLYLTGIVATLTSNIVAYIRLFRLLNTGQTEWIDGIKVKKADVDMPSFSWGRYIVISRSDVGSAVFMHEKMHIKCRHSMDLMLHSLITTIHWFNPLVWIAHKELKTLHEYEADELTLKTGINPEQYQILLVKKAVDARQFRMANGFYHSKLKNRIIMINKKKTNRLMRLAYIICIPAIIGAMCCCSQRKGNNAQTGTPAATEAAAETVATVSYSEIFEKPTFNGGDANSFAQWVYGQIKYPQQCIDEQIQGRVVLQFTINATGQVCDVNVLRGVNPAIDEEAVRAVKASPAWAPGKTEDGKAVPVTFTFPIVFALR
jgi:TonB family protein